MMVLAGNQGRQTWLTGILQISCNPVYYSDGAGGTINGIDT